MKLWSNRALPARLFTRSGSAATSEASLVSSANRKIVAPDANRCTEASVPKGLRPARAASDFSSEFETVGKKEGGERGRGEEGAVVVVVVEFLPRSPNVDRAPIFNGMEKKKRKGREKRRNEKR